MKKFLKILGVSLLIVAIVLSAIFLPSMFNKNSSYLNSADAYIFTKDNDVLNFTSDTFFAQRFPTSTTGSTMPEKPSSNNRFFVNYSFQFTRYSNTLSISSSILYVDSLSYSILQTDGYKEFYFAFTNTSGSVPVTQQGHLPIFLSDNLTTGFAVYTTNYLIDVNFIGFTISDYTNYGLGIPSYYNVGEYIVYTFFNAVGDYVSIFISYDGLLKEDYSFIYMNTGTYYFNQDGQFNDNSYYNQGLNDGYVKGLADGESVGYSNGFEAGEISGYSNGYNQGVENANEYTFTALIGAVFDAPITAFTSLFNFNILGFNVLSFLTSLLTLCVVIFILKLVLGGK